MRDSIAKLLGPGGRFAKLCEGYEHRDEQVEMAEAVADALLHKEHLLVEAGTGVGKTVAYLTPAVLHATGGRPVIVSTHTINLQSQLVNKDIPMMAEVMDEHPFKAVLMKGRSNFVCLQEIDHYAGGAALRGLRLRAAAEVGRRDRDRRRVRARLRLPRLGRGLLQRRHLQGPGVPV